MISRNSLAKELRNVCNYEGIILSRDEVEFHLNKLQSENIPSGISKENLAEIIFDYLQESKLVNSK